VSGWFDLRDKDGAFPLKWETLVKFFQGIGMVLYPKAGSPYATRIALGNEAPVYGWRSGDKI
jgi:hypothetical protein